MLQYSNAFDEFQRRKEKTKTGTN